MSKEAELLEHVAKSLVDDPSGVVVKEEQDGDFLKLHLQVAEADVGKVIGRGGRIAIPVATSPIASASARSSTAMASDR